MVYQRPGPSRHDPRQRELIARSRGSRVDTPEPLSIKWFKGKQLLGLMQCITPLLQDGGPGCEIVSVRELKLEAKRVADRERQAKARKDSADLKAKVKRVFEFERERDQLRAQSWISHEEFAEAMSALIANFADVVVPEDLRPLQIVNGRVVDKRIPLMSAGSFVDVFLPDGTRGSIKLTLTDKPAEIQAAHDRDRDGRKARPQGAGIKYNDDGAEKGGKFEKGRYVEDKPPKFKATLGGDSENYKLDAKQRGLERLIKDSKVRAVLKAFWASEEHDWRNYEETRRNRDTHTAQTWEQDRQRRIDKWLEDHPDLATG